MYLCQWMFLSILSVTYACYPWQPLTFGVYNDRCISVAECKRRSFVVFEGTCVRACPPGSKYLEETRTCYKICPNDTLETDTKCLNGSYCLLQGQLLFNGSCQNESCPEDWPFIKYGTCYRVCPRDTIINGSQCIYVEDCIREKYVFNDTCVTECPQFASLINNGHCNRTCQNDTVRDVNGTTCYPMQDCTGKKHAVVLNDTCISSCPPEAPYQLQSKCYTDCPENHVMNISTLHCIPELMCMYYGFYIHNRTCVRSCPFYTTKIRNVNMCYSRCPREYVIYGNQCISSDACKAEGDLFYVVYNGTCIPSCPPEVPYNHDGLCVQQCANNTFERDMKCIDNSECINYGYRRYKDLCLSECPHEAPNKYGVSCVLHCPYQLVSDNHTCISRNECIAKKRKYVFNDTCYSSCPKEARSHRNGICSTKCPDDKILNSTVCIPRNECKLLWKDQCVINCPKVSPYMSQNICLEQCPYNAVRNGSQCISSANCTKKIYNKTCVENCPNMAPMSLGKICRSECPLGYISLSGSNCVLSANCKRLLNGTVIQNGTTCLNRCPKYAPYASKNKNICLTQCPKDNVAEGFTCISQYMCSGIVYQGRCLNSCPPEAPYMQYSHCYALCPAGTVIKGNKCIYKSLCNLIYNGTCIEDVQCPEEAKYKMDKTCYSKCPEGKLIDLNGSECTDTFSCRMKGFVMGNVCVRKCPKGFVALTSTCFDLSVDKREACIMSVLMVITFVCVCVLIYNPKKRDTSTASTEMDEIENGLGGIQDYLVRRDRRGIDCDDEGIATQQMVTMNGRSLEEDETDLVVVHKSANEDGSGDDEPLLRCVDNVDGAENVDDAMLFGEGYLDPNRDGGVQCELRATSALIRCQV